MFRLIDKNGRNPAFSNYLSGKTLQSQGQYKGAIDHYRLALKANPDLGRASGEPDGFLSASRSRGRAT